MLVRPDDEERDNAAYRQAAETEAAHSTPQVWQDVQALDRCRGSFSLASQVEKLHYAAILLREQGRIEHILRDRDVAPLKRELIWVALYPHLLACGYTLPSPYEYGTPGTSVSYTMPLQRRRKERPLDMVHYTVLPATVKHGKQRRVALKIVCTRPGTDFELELEILKYLNGEPIRSHPDNIAVPLLDVIDFPQVNGQPRADDLHIIVMPLLRPFSRIVCGTNGTVLGLMRRMFRSLAFLTTASRCDHFSALPTMTRPNLHRVSDTFPSRFDIVRPGIDVELVGGVVLPNRGGVSVFASKDPSWPAEKTVVLPSTVALPNDLVAFQDRGSYCLLRPSREMTLDEYKTALSLLGAHAIAYDGTSEESPPLNLPAVSENDQREVRFLYEALMTVSRERLSVEGWDDNDYPYVRLLAAALENGELPFRSVIWSADVGWTREAAYVAYATHAYMVRLRERATSDDDADADADAMNDTAFLCALLQLTVPENPFSHLAL